MAPGDVCLATFPFWGRARDEIAPGSPAHLKTISILRLHKLATIHARNIVRHLGELEPSQRGAVAARLRQFLGL